MQQRYLTIGLYTECLSEKEVLCASGLACIQKTARCNGVTDCPDHSDEIGCGKVLFVLPTIGLVCFVYSAVSMRWAG